jgi:NHL repeat
VLAGNDRELAELEVVATGVQRPLQLALDGDDLVVLGPGSRGDAAGEIYRLSLRGELPVDLSHQPRITIPFADSQAASLGSLAVDPMTRELYLGEENGRRIYRMTPDERLLLYATGLRRLAGGSTLAFDARGRLAVVDFADPSLSESEDRPPPGLEQFREEDYRGPIVLRLELDPAIPLPRRLGKAAPLFPRAWGGKSGGAILPHLIAVATVGSDVLVLLDSRGELYRIDREGGPRPFTKLPRGQYNRINLTSAPDGSIVVSGGFHTGRVFRVRPDGLVTLLAENLADPEGIAVDRRGNVYVAESSFHRIVRLRPL